MKLLVDMNLSPRWVDVLKAVGIDAVHWASAGPGNSPDTAIMAYAGEYDFVVLTHDLDFGAILAATAGKKPSVVQIRSWDVSPEVVGQQVLASIKQLRRNSKQGRCSQSTLFEPACDCCRC